MWAHIGPTGAGRGARGSVLGVERHTITRYVEALREGGSLPGLVEADDDGLYVVKLRGAGQGVRALVAEIVVGLLAAEIGIRTPELALLELADAIGWGEPDPEIQSLLLASTGINVGVDFLPGSLPYVAHGAAVVPADEAAGIIWLDFLTTNVDRTARNPNLLWWHGALWAIDHGAALYRHHASEQIAGDADRPFPQIAEHVLLAQLGDSAEERRAVLLAAHERLAPLVTRAALDRIVSEIPADWRDEHDYASYLVERVRVVGEQLAGTMLSLESAPVVPPAPGEGAGIPTYRRPPRPGERPR